MTQCSEKDRYTQRVSNTSSCVWGCVCVLIVVICALVLFILVWAVEIPWSNFHHIRYATASSLWCYLIYVKWQTLYIYNGVEDSNVMISAAEFKLLDWISPYLSRVSQVSFELVLTSDVHSYDWTKCCFYFCFSYSNYCNMSLTLHPPKFHMMAINLILSNSDKKRSNGWMNSQDCVCLEYLESWLKRQA